MNDHQEMKKKKMIYKRKQKRNNLTYLLKKSPLLLLLLLKKHLELKLPHSILSWCFPDFLVFLDMPKHRGKLEKVYIIVLICCALPDILFLKIPTNYEKKQRLLFFFNFFFFKNLCAWWTN